MDGRASASSRAIAGWLWLPRDPWWLLWWQVQVLKIYAVLYKWEKLQSVYVECVDCTERGDGE